MLSLDLLPEADQALVVRRLLEIAIDALEPALRAYVAIVHDPAAEELLAALDTFDAARADA